jgi:hypothetical protein
MALQLPSFEDTACLYLIACGRLLTDDNQVLRWLKEPRRFLARYGSAQRTRLIRLATGGEDLGHFHFHIDIATRQLFERKLTSLVPKPTHKLADVSKAYAKVRGQQIDVDITGAFLVPISELPLSIRSTLAETREGDVVVQMTGARLSIRGTPIHSIEWSIRENQDDAYIELGARKKLALDDTYLEECLRVVDSGFKALVHGGLHMADRRLRLPDYWHDEPHAASPVHEEYSFVTLVSRPREEGPPEAAAPTPNWEQAFRVAINRLTAEVATRAHQFLRLATLEKDVQELKASVKALIEQRVITVPITTFAPEPYELIKAMKAVVQPVEDEFVATFFDANINASGGTQQDAVANLKDMMLGLLEVLEEEPADKLGKEPARQLAVLREFIRRKA